jgi:F0F1-type ATP synthase assembly protein I
MADDSRRGTARAYQHAALGMQFAGGVIVFTGAGFALDRWLGLMPVLTVAGALIGATLGFLSVLTRVKAEDEARRKEREAKPE